MSRAGTLRRWTICAAVLLLAGASRARAQAPASTQAPPAAASATGGVTAPAGTTAAPTATQGAATKAPATTPKGLVTPAELAATRTPADTSHAKRTVSARAHRARSDQLVAVTSLTAALGKIVEPAVRIAPEPIVVADATTWPVSLTASGRGGASADGVSLAHDVARVLDSDSVRAAAAVPVIADGDTTRQGRGPARAAPAPAVQGAPTAAPSMTVAMATAAPSGAPSTPPATGTGGTAPAAPSPQPAGAPAASAPSNAAPNAHPAAVAVSVASPQPTGTPAGTAPLSAAPNAHATAPAAPAVLGQPVNGFAPDATRVAAPATASFVRDQLASARVAVARGSADTVLRAAFEHAGVPYPGAVYLRAFKREHELEIWGRKADGTYALVKTYSICSLGGSALGPKLHRGDEQVPEGFYHVIEFNPSSEYHLSLRLDYPNAADRARKGSDDLGGDIYLHGGCKSAGCLPLTDQGIEQVYWLAVQARGSGQHQIPIDIFPARLDAGHWTQLSQAFAKRPDLLAFWADLKLGFDAFEQSHRLPDIAIDAAGRYRIALTTR